MSPAANPATAPGVEPSTIARVTTTSSRKFGVTPMIVMWGASAA